MVGEAQAKQLGASPAWLEAIVSIAAKEIGKIHGDGE